MKNEIARSYQFSGHETFPLRQLWLMKAVHYTNDRLASSKGKIPASFSGEVAMNYLGVGKNMVSSILYWARACAMIEENSTHATLLGKLIFGDFQGSVGLDPYNESITTAWLVHWNLCSVPYKCSAFWFIFNYMTKMDLSRTDLVDAIMEFVKHHDCKVSELTVKRAVDVCLRSYVPNFACRSKAISEEFVEPLLGSLGLMQVKSRDVISMKRTPRPTLHPALFAYCLLDYWQNLGQQASTLDFTRLMHDVGSPGKVFRVDETSLVNYLEQLEQLTNGSMLWSDQAGIRTLTFKKTALTNAEKLKRTLLTQAYQEL